VLAGLAFLVASSAYSLAADELPFQLPAQCYASSGSRGGRGFLSWGSPRLQARCADAESFQLHYTDVYQEAYKQFKVCLRAHGGFSASAVGARSGSSSGSSSGNNSGGGSVTSSEARNRFLTVDRRVSSVCEPANQFVRQPVAGAGATTYCLYSPVRGLFVSAAGRPSALCGRTEQFTVTGRARPREAAQWLLGLAPAFCRATFLVRSPLYALLAYALLALCEMRRPPRPKSKVELYTAELLSAAVWFMVNAPLFPKRCTLALRLGCKRSVFVGSLILCGR
jgi:hypothetical protein